MRAVAAGRGAKARSALAELSALRQSGTRQLDKFEYAGEDDVYDLVDEDRYAEIVRQRREEGGKCVARGICRWLSCH